MEATFRSSMTIKSWSLTNLRESLWARSWRLVADLSVVLGDTLDSTSSTVRALALQL